MGWIEKKKVKSAAQHEEAFKQPNIHRLRRVVQWMFLFLLNPFIILGILGIMTIDVFQEQYQKMEIVFPVMNCYACPAAAMSCPIGAMGNLFAHGMFPFLVIGIFFIVGALVGKMFCGWVCPFGLVQELLYKIPGKKISLPKFTTYFKYVFLVVTVIIIPILWGTKTGTGTPSEIFFCNICPAASLEATIPMQIQLASEGKLYWHQVFTNLLVSFKFWILIFFIFLFIVSKRPFCKMMCPIGATYGLFNWVSFFKVKVDKSKCTSCNFCERNCPIDHSIKANCKSPECIRCLECEFELCDYDAVETNMSLTRKPISMNDNPEIVIQEENVNE